MRRYDYSKTMMMKLLLTDRDNNEGSKIYSTLEEALDTIRKVDNLTCGCPKIIYLVGWQYLGHDDKYPAFFEVNEKLKRPQDKTALDSLLWLMSEAKKYNTVISYHINLSDAYADSPLWNEYVQNDLILKRNNGKLKPTGVWNGKTAYQVRFAEEVNKGFFAKRVDKLISLLPLTEAKTVHVDAFFVRKGQNTNIESEKAARRQMIKYLDDKGIDVTSEFIYREHKNGDRSHYGKSDTVGLIPAFWNPVYSRRDILKYPAAKISGGVHCRALTLDKSIEWLIYGNIQGEDIFKINKTDETFGKLFATYNMPYFYLNSFSRLKILGFARGRRLVHSGGVVSRIKGKTITCGKKLLKEGNELCLPAHWLDNSYIAYSEKQDIKKWYVSDGEYTLYKVTGEGKERLEKVQSKNGEINYNAAAETEYLLEKCI